jgi:hypothetical protein
MRNAHERLGLRVDERGPPPVDPLAEAVGEPVRAEVGGKKHDEEPGPAKQHGEHQAGNQEDEPVRADPGKADEEPVEPADAMVDDPALEMPVGRDQVGSSCLVWSTSSWGLKGLPTKPWAPRAVASSASSSTLPLNMITGMAPTPCRS